MQIGLLMVEGAALIDQKNKLSIEIDINRKTKTGVTSKIG